jgi:hypothetical protein
MSKMGFMMKAGWPALAALLLAIAGYFLFEDRYEKVDGQLESERAGADRIQVDLKNSQRTVEELAAAKQNIREYRSGIFGIDETQRLIDRIDDKALQHGASMADIQIDVPKFMEIRKGNEPEFMVPFQVSFAGDFFSLGSLLSALEKAPFVYEVTDAALVLPGNSDEGLTMTLKGTVRFFSNDLVDRYLSDAG